MIKGLLSALLALSLSGCATLFSSPSDQIRIESRPRGATVVIAGQEVGVTPLTVEVFRDPVRRMVSVSHADYPSVEFDLKRRINWLILLNGGFFPGWIVDHQSGAMYRHRPRHYMVDLETGNISMSAEREREPLLLGFLPHGVGLNTPSVPGSY